MTAARITPESLRRLPPANLPRDGGDSMNQTPHPPGRSRRHSAEVDVLEEENDTGSTGSLSPARRGAASPLCRPSAFLTAMAAVFPAGRAGVILHAGLRPRATLARPLKWLARR